MQKKSYHINVKEQNQSQKNEQKHKPEQDGFNDKTDHKIFDVIFDECFYKIDQNFEKKAEQKFRCECSICEKSTQIPLQYIEPKQKISYNTSQNKSRPQKINERDYIYVLKRMVPPQRGFPFLQLNIPNTVCFINGDPRYIVFSQKDRKTGLISIIKIVDKMTLENIKKQFIEQRKKYFEQFKIQDQQDRQLERYKAASICKYDDDNAYIMNGQEFSNLFTKRKTDQFWQKIQYLQNLIKTKKPDMVKIKFNRRKQEESDLEDRALIYVKSLNRQIPQSSSESIQQYEEEMNLEKQLKLQDIEKYLRYQSYKIVYYLQVFYGSNIQKGQFEWIKDELEDWYFVNAHNVKYIEEQVSIISDEIFYKALDEQALKKLTISQDLLQKYEKRENHKSNRIFQQMQEEFKQQKISVGIDLDYFNVQEDDRNDQAFSQLHPDIKKLFREITKSLDLYQKLKKKIFGSVNCNDCSKSYGNSKMLNQFFYPHPKKRENQELNQTFTQFTHKDFLVKNQINQDSTYNYNSPDKNNIEYGFLFQYFQIISNISDARNFTTFQRKYRYLNSSSVKKRQQLGSTTSGFDKQIKKNTLPYFLIKK